MNPLDERQTKGSIKKPLQRNSYLFIVAQAILLSAVALLTAPWLLNLANQGKPNLSPGWAIEGNQAKRTARGITLPPKHRLSYRFDDKSPGSELELEIHLQIDEYHRFAISAGSKEDCNRFQRLFPIDPQQISKAPSRINMVIEPKKGMIYEDGTPVYGFQNDLEKTECISIQTLDSLLTVSSVAIREQSKRILTENFWAGPGWNFKFIAVSLMLFAGLFAWTLLEMNLAINKWQVSPNSIFISQVLAITPLLVASIFMAMNCSGARLITASLICFLFFRLAFFYRHFPGLLKKRTGVFRFFVFLVLAAAFFLILAQFSGRIFVHYLAALALVNVPFAAICLAYRYADSLRRFSLVITFLLLALLICVEAGLRIVEAGRPPAGYAPVEIPDMDDLLFRGPKEFASDNPGLPIQQYQFHRPSFRSGDTPEKKPEGVFRIAVLGGSNVWGLGIEDPKKTFPGVMEETLNEGEGRYEVINAGQDGFGSFHALVLFKHLVANYQPDLTIYYLLYNDLQHAYGMYTLREAYEIFGSRKGQAILRAQKTLDHFRLYNVLSENVVAMRRGIFPGLGEKGILKETTTPDDFKANLEEMISICEKKNIKPVFVVEYLSMERAAGISYQEYQQERIMIKLAALKKIPVFNANRYFSQNVNWAEMVDEKDPLHLNQEGHEKLGRILVDFLQSEKLLANGGE